jgi:hypothetical protein
MGGEKVSEQKISSRDRRGMDGGLKALKTCYLSAPPKTALQRSRRHHGLEDSEWGHFCNACAFWSGEPTREAAIEAHRAHVAAEHTEE